MPNVVSLFVLQHPLLDVVGVVGPDVDVLRAAQLQFCLHLGCRNLEAGVQVARAQWVGQRGAIKGIAMSERCVCENENVWHGVTSVTGMMRDGPGVFPSNRAHHRLRQ